MLQIFSIIQIVTAILLIILILLQSQGSGLGEIFGGDGNVFRKKRGAEKILFQVTIITAILFFGASLAHTLV